MNVKTSELDNVTIVIEVEDGDEGPIVEMLNVRENGFAVFGEGVDVPMAVVDSRLFKHDWFTSAHLLAIEAHELGHIRMQSEEESVAEREGVRLLQSAGYNEAANILLERGVL